MDEGKWAFGRWQVKEGKTDEFLARWNEWIGWTSEHVPGFRSARLLRAEEDPRRFTSVSEWDDGVSLKAWKTTEGFTEKLEACKRLCNEFLGGDFDVAASYHAAAAVRV
jgi:heme-degrading monooxygenase HmoA